MEEGEKEKDQDEGEEAGNIWRGTVDVGYIIDFVMVHQFYSTVTSDHQPKQSNHLNLLVPDWLFASSIL